MLGNEPEHCWFVVRGITVEQAGDWSLSIPEAESADARRGREAVRKAVELAGRLEGVGFADARFCHSEGTQATIQDGRADRISAGSSFGIGLRVLVDGAWGFASADTVDARSLERLADRARSMARASAPLVKDLTHLDDVQPVRAEHSTPCAEDPADVPIREKMDVIRTLERSAVSAADGKVVNSVATYRDASAFEVVANTAGTLVSTHRVWVTVAVILAGREGEILERAANYKGFVSGFEAVRALSLEELGVKTAGDVLTQLKSPKAPPGTLRVIFQPKITGLLIHEALGHNAEADAVRSGESLLDGKMGQQIAAERVTVVDDPLRTDGFGFYAYDAEGTPAGERVIVRDGVLVGLLHTLETASKFDVAPNGAARAQSHHVRPIVRMGNTFVAAGADSFDNMVASTDRGMYLEDGDMGYVHPEKGMFTLHATKARMIEKGQLGETVRDVSASGMILDTLKKVEMVAGDVSLDGVGFCGKNGQSVPVGDGGPHILISSMVIGGSGERRE